MDLPLLRMEGLRVERVRGSRLAGPAAGPLVDGISLELRRGEVLALIGESGAGKTTVGLAAMGYVRPGARITAGRILFDGQDLATARAEQLRAIRGRRIAYVAQSAAASFNPALRLGRQVAEVAVRHGAMTWAQARQRACELFDELRLPDPGGFGERFPHQVSGGQLQRAMAAMAVSCRPDILVLDEPTTALDVTTQLEFLVSLRTLIRSHGTAALYISHDLAVVAQVAQRILVLRDGRMVEQNETGRILGCPEQDYTRRLLSVRALVAVDRAVPAPSAAPLLEVSGVVASYGSYVAIKGATLSLDRGETLAVVGESGSGKSTLARLVCGLKVPAAGSIRFGGRPLPPGLAGRSKDEKRRIQLIYQMPDTALNPSHTVGKIIGRPLAFYHGLGEARRRARVAELLQAVELAPEIATRFPAQLSGGQKQRVCIARALAAEPDLIICDEVTSALDALVAEEILKLLDRLQQQNGIACLFITHDLGIVRRVADRVAVMLGGDIVAQGPTERIFRPPFHPYTEKLLACVPELRETWLDERLASRKQDAGVAAIVDAS